LPPGRSREAALPWAELRCFEAFDREVEFVLDLTGSCDVWTAITPSDSYRRACRRRALDNVYRHADALIVPSLYEPWGLVVHEGLAHGLPVIVTDQVGAADDLIDPGTDGIIVPAGSWQDLADSMRTLAAWTDEHYDRAVMRSADLLTACSIEAAVRDSRAHAASRLSIGGAKGAEGCRRSLGSDGDRQSPVLVARRRRLCQSHSD
jgi:glycosyltransferase involved in cell wall biosynthesis